MIANLFHAFAKFAWFLPGFLLWAAYPPMGERADALFALAPLLWLSRRTLRAKESAFRWFQGGLVFWIATLSWMPAIVKNGGPWPLVVLGWFALAGYCAAYFAAYGYLSASYWQWARERAYLWRLLGVLIVEPVLWCGLELVRSRLGGGFAWNQLGVVPVNSGFGAPAALGGVYLCSAVVVLVNGTIAGIAERMWKPEKSGFANLKKLGSLETLLAFALVFGIHQAAHVLERTRVHDLPETPHGSLKVALVQRNFPCVFKLQEEKPYEVYGKLMENVADYRPDLVVLPESGLCEFGPVDQQGAVRFASWVREKTGAALLAGGTRYADGLTYNSAAYYGTNGEYRVYDKVHLVPFGEFIPGDKWFPALQKLAPVGSCTPGELQLLDVCGVPSGVAICFEDTDSAQLRELAAKGARLLFFVTNDSWFSHSIEAEQHAWQSVARAIETGLPVVRVGNGGVTGIVSPEGHASWLPGPGGRPLTDRRGTMFDRVTLADRGLTPYVRFGDFPLGIAFVLLIACLILIKYRNDYE